MNEFSWTIPIPTEPLSVEIRGTDTAITGIRFLRETTKPANAPAGSLAEQAARQLTEYFNGERTAFDLPLDPAGTPFQKRVLEASSKFLFNARSNENVYSAIVFCPYCGTLDIWIFLFLHSFKSI